MKAFLVKIALTILLVPAPGLAQPGAVEQNRQQLERLEMQLMALQSREKALSRQIDSLAVLIQKQKGKTSFLARRSLGTLLKRSDEYAKQFQSVQEQKALLLDSLYAVAETTLKTLNRVIPEMARQRSRAKRANRARQADSLAQALKSATALRKRCQRLLNRVPPQLALIKIQVRPGDPPEVVRQKAGFILDQADRLRRLSQQAQKKISELKSEITLRSRLRDFVQDLQLFDPSAEAVGANEISRTSLAGEKAIFDVGATRGFPESDLSSGAIITILPDWPANIAALSEADLQTWIKKIQTERKLWIAKADSLEQRAQRIRKSLEHKP